jgi:biopolymer transport protein ExbD
MQNRASLTATDEQTNINISPLIDMVFILLIFFIVTTVFVEEPGVDVNKPRAVSIENLEKNSILIAITSNARIVYGGKDIGIGGVRPIVQRLTQKDPMPVILQIDQSAPGTLVVRAIDEAKLAGATKVSLSALRL